MSDIRRSPHSLCWPQGCQAKPTCRIFLAWTNKTMMVVGPNNSAHDICAALWEANADVTMLQRPSTHIVRSDTPMDIGGVACLAKRQWPQG